LKIMKEIMLKIRNAWIVLMILSIVSACSSNFLDQPVSGNFAETDFYKNNDEAQNGLVAVYDAYSSSYNAVWASTYLARELPSDDCNAGGADAQDQLGWQTLDDFNIDPQNDQLQGVWTNLWAALYRANKSINKTSADTPEGKQIIAEAKVLRGFIYMDLLLWGGVPLVTKDVAPSEWTTTPRASKADILSFLADDLETAIADLPVKSDLSVGNKFRAHKGTAQALRGKVLLYNEKWSDAATQFDQVISSGQYALENDGMAPFNEHNEFGKESLFELNYGGDNGGNFPWGANSDDNIIIQLMGPRSDYYFMAPADSLLGGWGYCPPTQDLFNTFDAAGDVTRQNEFLWTQAKLEAEGGSWTKPSQHDYEGFIRRKYGTYSTQTTTDNGYVNYATNWVLLRYSDVLLMAAEAKFRAGDESGAKTHLNAVRARPSTNLPAITSSGATLFNDIVAERRMELCFEGHRFSDLVRWGLAEAELADLNFVEGKHNQYPIPQVDVNAGKLEQNPGY
jgi:hypothetical protein